jgi:hypothetical protein
MTQVPVQKVEYGTISRGALAGTLAFLITVQRTSTVTIGKIRKAIDEFSDSVNVQHKVAFFSDRHHEDPMAHREDRNLAKLVQTLGEAGFRTIGEIRGEYDYPEWFRGCTYRIVYTHQQEWLQMNCNELHFVPTESYKAPHIGSNHIHNTILYMHIPQNANPSDVWHFFANQQLMWRVGVTSKALIYPVWPKEDEEQQ